MAKTMLRNLITQIVRGVPISNPRAVFIGGVDGFWLDPSDLDSLWVDEERTQHPTSPGDVVWWIDDKSGNNNHFGAPSSAARGRLYRWPASAVLEGYPRTILTNNSIDMTGWEQLLNSTSSGPYVVGGRKFYRVGRTGTNTASRIRQGLSLASGPDDYTINMRSIANPAGSGYISGILGTSVGAGGVRFAFNTATGTFESVFGATVPDTVHTAVKDSDDVWHLVFSFIGVSPDTAHICVYTDLFLGTDAAYTDAADVMVTIGSTPSEYQAIGSGIWDVTEEGQEDCWGVAGDGISTLYRSTRGLLYIDNKMRAALGVTKQSTLGSNPVFFSTSTVPSEEGNYRLYSDPTDSYRALLRQNGVNSVTSSIATYLPPSPALLDYQANGNEQAHSLRVNNDSPGSADGAESGPLSGDLVNLFGYGNASSLSPFILWGTILVAEEPDPGKWETHARQWLSNHNMGGILS